MGSCKNDFLYTLLGKALIPFLFFLELKFYLNHAPEGQHIQSTRYERQTVVIRDPHTSVIQLIQCILHFFL